MGPLEYISSSPLSVRLKTADDDGQIFVVVLRSAIEDKFGLSSSTTELRRELVETNIIAISGIVLERLKWRRWTQSMGGSGHLRQVVLRSEDLENARLQCKVVRDAGLEADSDGSNARLRSDKPDLDDEAALPMELRREPYDGSPV